jgi:glycosyltransferase involved in cell wall biosynthesis
MATGDTLVMAAVIPALNEAASIGAVVRAVKPFAMPIVVDDGSNDQTAALARAEGAEVVSHPQRRGYDAALESGMQRASDLGYRFAVTMDADGQHRADVLPRFREGLEKGAKLVVGVRDRHQRFAESMFAVVGGLLWGVRDPLCGMKGYDLATFRAAGRFDSYGSIGTELTIRICRSGMAVTQVDVPTSNRVGAARFGAGLKPNLRILRAMLLGLLRARPIATRGVAR